MGLMGQHELKGWCEYMDRYEPLGRHEPMGRHEAMDRCEVIGRRETMGRREPKGRHIDRRERLAVLRAYMGRWYMYMYRCMR